MFGISKNFRKTATHLFTQSQRTVSGTYKWPAFTGEPMMDYAPGSKERADLVEALKKVRSEVVEIPCIINGKEVYTGNVIEQVIPSDHNHVIARVHQAGREELSMAIDSALKAREEWDLLPQYHRGQVFRRAADLISTKHRAYMNAVTMLGTAKTVWQAEIDSAAEQCDFLRANAKFAEDIYKGQPELHANGTWNRLNYRGLEGFVAAISPFNFCAIGTNLTAAPAMMGTVSLWKPSHTATLENYVAMRILMEAGLPPGVINFLPSAPEVFENVVRHQDFAGLHFTGSTKVFQHLWKEIGNNITNYKSFPRIVGETGGKNYHMVHRSAPVELVALNTVRAAFEYQGQKCSACSRMYAPKSLWPQIKEAIVEHTKSIRMGQPDDFSVFMSAVIDNNAMQKHKRYLDQAKAGPDTCVIVGGNVDGSTGYFVEPTVIETTDPRSPTMTDELFGPVLTVYVYDDAAPRAWEEVLELANTTSPYGLTGAVFALDRTAIATAESKLRHACGNFYINDKCTGAVVGEQPFGGARASGTNDKAGSALNLMRWTSAQAVKETTVEITDYRYPYMRAE